MAQADVFISYASSDKLVADAVCARLEAQEIRCWIAPRDVGLGHYAESLHRAIGMTKIMVVILSREANASPIVLREVERAVVDGDFIVPFRIEEVELSRGMEMLISSNHWLDAMTPPLESRIQELATKVGLLLSTQAGVQLNRSRRRNLVEAVRHPPHENRSSPGKLSEPPAGEMITPRKRWWKPLPMIAIIVAAVALIAFAIDFMVFARSAPQLQAPADRAFVIEDFPQHRWSFDGAGLPGLEFEVLMESSTGAISLGKAGTTSYSEIPEFTGSMTWQVRAIWRDGDQLRESAWSAPRTVTWYPDTLTKIVETGVVSLAFSEDAVQFEGIGNEPTGFEIEFMRRALGSHLENQGRGDLDIQRTSFFAWGDQFFHALKNPQFDVMIGGITILESRERDWGIKFTKPLYCYPQSFVYLRNRVDPQDCLARGPGATPCRIGVKGGTTNEKLALELAPRGNEGTEIRSYTQDEVYDPMAREIASGEIDLAIMDRPYALLLKEKNGDLVVEDIDDSLQEIGIATRPSDFELRRVLNAAIPTYRSEIEELLSNLERRTGSGQARTVTAELPEP